MKRALCIDERARQDADLARKHARQLEAFDASAVLEVRQLEAAQRVRRLELQAKQVREQVDLWVAQKRTLGPWVAPVLEGKLPAGHPVPGEPGLTPAKPEGQP